MCFDHQGYLRAAGAALSACAKNQRLHFDKEKAVKDCFEECREKLVGRYKPYTDRQEIGNKRRDAESTLRDVTQGLYSTEPRTFEQIRQEMRGLLEFADKAIRLHMAGQEIGQSNSITAETSAPTMEGGIS